MSVCYFSHQSRELSRYSERRGERRLLNTNLGLQRFVELPGDVLVLCVQGNT